MSRQSSIKKIQIERMRTISPSSKSPKKNQIPKSLSNKQISIVRDNLKEDSFELRQRELVDEEQRNREKEEERKLFEERFKNLPENVRNAIMVA